MIDVPFSEHTRAALGRAVPPELHAAFPAWTLRADRSGLAFGGSDDPGSDDPSSSSSSDPPDPAAGSLDLVADAVDLGIDIGEAEESVDRLTRCFWAIRGTPRRARVHSSR